MPQYLIQVVSDLLHKVHFQRMLVGTEATVGCGYAFPPAGINFSVGECGGEFFLPRIARICWIFLLEGYCREICVIILIHYNPWLERSSTIYAKMPQYFTQVDSALVHKFHFQRTLVGAEITEGCSFAFPPAGINFSVGECGGEFF